MQAVLASPRLAENIARMIVDLATFPDSLLDLIIEPDHLFVPESVWRWARSLGPLPPGFWGTQ